MEETCPTINIFGMNPMSSPLSWRQRQVADVQLQFYFAKVSNLKLPRDQLRTLTTQATRRDYRIPYSISSMNSNSIIVLIGVYGRVELAKLWNRGESTCIKYHNFAA